MWDRVRRDHPEARLAIVPRKPERFDAVALLIEDNGFKVIRRSETRENAAASRNGDAITLGDTMGELRKFYGLAAGIFVGRSLVEMGGSDMIEAAALAKPTAYGPYTYNFPQADALADEGGVRVRNADELEKVWVGWLDDPASAKTAGRRAQNYVRSQQGATRRSVEMLCSLLGRRPAVAEGCIATDVILR